MIRQCSRNCGWDASYQPPEVKRCLICNSVLIRVPEEMLEEFKATTTAYQLVQEQAEDEALWTIYQEGKQPVIEAYLKQELRKLHLAVEGK